MDRQAACEYALGALPEAEMGEARIYNVENPRGILIYGYFKGEEPEDARACEPGTVQIATIA